MSGIKGLFGKLGGSTAMLGQIMQVAEAGPGALGGLLAQVAPNAMEALLYQRQASLLLARAADVNFAAGQFAAVAMREKRDLRPDEIAKLRQAMAQLLALAHGMAQANSRAGHVLHALALAYGAEPPEIAPQESTGAAVVPLHPGAA